MTFMYEFDKTTVQAVARHVRGMLRGIKRGPKNTHELATALAAAKIVVRTLDEAARAAGIDESVILAGDELARDMGKVMDLVRWR